MAAHGCHIEFNRPRKHIPNQTYPIRPEQWARLLKTTRHLERFISMGFPSSLAWQHEKNLELEVKVKVSVSFPQSRSPPHPQPISVAFTTHNLFERNKRRWLLRHALCVFLLCWSQQLCIILQKLWMIHSHTHILDQLEPCLFLPCILGKVKTPS